ncbi:GL13881 [Drosophila persimilis]|uniref:GL13881 n=1 Tax=Drosophila persimilis TaxID=7234 RepID=B4GPH8_DROPE|nr:GL13881 [Drosophila persimilis]
MLWILLVSPAALSLLPMLLNYRGVVANVTVMDDIRNAFRGVTNDTELLDHIIPEMYGSSMRSANPTFVFRMPTRGSGDGYELLTMQRSDFAEPIFPNITEVSATTSTAPLTAEPPETNVKTSLVTSPHAEWQQMGLEGWSGELKPPLPWLEQSHKDTHPAISWQNTYPRDEILLDLKNKHFDGRVTDIRVIAATSGRPAEMEDLMNGQNVYIARVNDPFGYSMKWTFNNASSQKPGPDQSPWKSKKWARIAANGDVGKLYSMIKCSTGCDPLIYKGYGCYCGFGGHGVPAEGIDPCCHLHDKCYGQSNCISYLEYFVSSVWKCYRGKPLCSVDQGDLVPHRELLQRLDILQKQTRRLVLRGVGLVGQQDVVGHEQHVAMQLVQATYQARVDVPLDGGQVHVTQTDLRMALGVLVVEGPPEGSCVLALLQRRVDGEK